MYLTLSTLVKAQHRNHENEILYSQDDVLYFSKGCNVGRIRGNPSLV